MGTRLPLAFLSVFGYLATRRLASTFNVDKYLSSVLWSSSYVTWTYFTRTFSNTVEAVLLSVVLLIVCTSPHVGNSGTALELKRKNEEDEGQTYKKTAVVNKSYRFRALILGILTVAGFFNRPTFLAFAAVPIIFWIYNVTMKHYRGNGVFNMCSVVFCMSVGAISTFSCFVLADTLYYRPGFLDEMYESIDRLVDRLVSSGFSSDVIFSTFKDSAAGLVVTPWNFVNYNMQTDNLAVHGIHPRYTHFVVNLPLLTGPLYLPILFITFVSIIGFFNRHKVTKEAHQTVWLTLMMLVPVSVLSVFPHQEPRFLIPLLPVLMVLGTKVVRVMSPAKYTFCILWGFFNIVLILVYSFLHQAALVPSMSIYQQKLSSRSGSNREHHAIFYNTYPPPRHLLLIKPETTNIKVHDLAGAHRKSLMKLIKETKLSCSRNQGKKCQLYVFLPATVSPIIQDRLSEYKVEITSICPHLSMEAPPRFHAWWMRKIKFDEFIMDFCLNILRIS